MTYLPIVPAQIIQFFNTKYSSPIELLLVALLGLVIGSYLNVVIYRGCAKYIPVKYKGKLTVGEPKGSFCPECLHKLSWYENIPLFSFIMLKGKCKHCNTSISMQYPAIEALTATIITTWWVLSPNLHSFLNGALLASLLIPCTVIDIKTLKIPNAITIGGTVAVLLLALIGSTPIQSFTGCIGAALLTFFFVQLGKLLFGKRGIVLKKPAEILWKFNENPSFTLQEEDKTLEESEEITTEELFTRITDSIEIEGDFSLIIHNQNKEEETIKCKVADLFAYKTMADKKEYNLPTTLTIKGQAKKIFLPQEAMGMGDVKLMALVGAGLGAMPAVYAITTAAVAAAVFGIIMRVRAKLKHENPPGLIAFGPWISAAALAVLLYTK